MFKLYEKNEYGIAPVFPFKANKNNLLINNVNYLKNTYRDNREKDYKKEITPLLNQAVELREKYFIGGEMIYYMEQPIQSKKNRPHLP